MLSKREWEEWKNLPATKEFEAKMQESIKFTKDAWASKQFVGIGIHEDAMTNAEVLGFIRALNQVTAWIENCEVQFG